MQKIFYNTNGWVCDRYPYDLKIDNENRFIEVEDEEYEKTLCCPFYYSWRVVNGKLSCEQYKQEPQEEKLKRLRSERIKLLEAFDIWEKAVLRGREEDSEMIMNWYQDVLDLKDSAFENIPERIEYYKS